MSNDILAIIPARAGSKGIKNKNTKLINGKPLISYAIDFAKKSKLIDKIVISSDDSKISKLYKDTNIDFIERPKDLCRDDSLVIDAIRYTIDHLKQKSNYVPKIIVLLECTSPIKSLEDLELAISKVQNNEADSATSFKTSDISPNRLWKIEDKDPKPYIDNSNPFLSRQKQPVAYKLTGQFYVFSNSILKNNKNSTSLMMGRVYPVISSTKFDIDIDYEADLILAEQIIKNLI